jgi:hypothetical protein
VLLGGFYAIGLSVIGVNFGALIGIISGFLSFIPYVGSLTGLVLSVGSRRCSSGRTGPGPGDARRLLRAVPRRNILQPKLVGNSIGVHPVWLMFALLAFGSLFGFVGLLLAVPLAAVIGVLCRFACGNISPATFIVACHRACGGQGAHRRRRLSHPCPKFPASAPARLRPAGRQPSWRRGFPGRRLQRGRLWPDRALAGLAEARLRLTGPEGAGRPISPRSGRASPMPGRFRQGADEAKCRISSRVRAGDRGLRCGRMSAPCSI